MRPCLFASRPASVAAVLSAALCAVFFATGAGSARDPELHWIVGGLVIGAYVLLALVVVPSRPGRLAWTLAAGQAGAGLLYAVMAVLLPLVLGPVFDLGVLAGGSAFGAAQLWILLSATRALAQEWPRPWWRRTAVVTTGTALFVGWIVPLALVIFPHTQTGESRAISDLRTFVSAQTAYRAVNGRLYGTPVCLFTPRTCISAYPADGVAFLEPAFLQDVRHGYRFTFHPGEEAVREGGHRGLVSWAYVAVPLNPGDSGIRSFCADASGTLRVHPDDEMPAPVGGACSPDAAPLH